MLELTAAHARMCRVIARIETLRGVVVSGPITFVDNVSAEYVVGDTTDDLQYAAFELAPRLVG